MKEFSFKNLSEYLEITSSLPGLFNCHPSDIWFRGIKDTKMKLVPGVVWRGMSEETEESAISEFMTYCQNYHGRKESNAYEVYALMQHYGLPTRLLDWSLSPLVSLYFALEQDNDGGAQRAIWAMAPYELNMKTMDFAGIIMPSEFNQSPTGDYLPRYLRVNQDPVPNLAAAISLPFTNQRVTSQKGAFTIHGYNSVPLDEIFTRYGLNGIACIKLKSEEYRLPLLDQLYSIGMREDDIYQDLNSLSKRIVRELGI
ncbi:FRG domain-containing protein [Aliivibrio fischeri]|uniref:FRG domain-containing protein n=1 Tax=Aliivibrio fischeri TaxID=668 RepID=UPI00105B3F58|nr:FRG domain-containing protein [Aliivibrio fischeri]TDM51424.1 FRG domain-containing protein [Aliivibrio fischeri]